MDLGETDRGMGKGKRRADSAVRMYHRREKINEIKKNNEIYYFFKDKRQLSFLNNLTFIIFYRYTMNYHNNIMLYSNKVAEFENFKNIYKGLEKMVQYPRGLLLWQKT